MLLPVPLVRVDNMCPCHSTCSCAVDVAKGERGSGEEGDGDW